MADEAVGKTREPGQPDQAEETNGKTLFCADDPQGYEITLDVDTWETHVLVRHPEIKDCLDLLKRTIKEPELIRRQQHGQRIFHYYRMAGRAKLRRNDLYFVAVIQREEQDKTGFVKTAHLVKKPKDGVTIWLRRS